MKILAIMAAIAASASVSVGQEKTPPVRVNVLNVCTPSAEDQKQIAAALDRIPAKPKWGDDFEVARGRSSLAGGAVQLEQAGASAPVSSDWARIRREFPG